jgi:hypothetical protein
MPACLRLAVGALAPCLHLSRRHRCPQAQGAPYHLAVDTASALCYAGPGLPYTQAGDAYPGYCGFGGLRER